MPVSLAHTSYGWQFGTELLSTICWKALIEVAEGLTLAEQKGN